MRMVRRAVAGMLRVHVRRAAAELHLDDVLVEAPRAHRAHAESRAFRGFVDLRECRAVRVAELGDIRRVEQRPRAAVAHAFHEDVIDPQRGEEGLRGVAARIAETHEILDVGVPGLHVDRRDALAFAAALIDVAHRRVVDLQHRRDTVRRAVGPLNVRPAPAHRRDVQPDAAAALRELRALGDTFEDGIQRVVDAHEVAGCERSARRPRVHQRRRRVRELTRGEPPVGL